MKNKKLILAVVALALIIAVFSALQFKLAKSDNG